ncbi:MAG: hypothetical protein QM762_13805 [Chryseolinea sp.]
MKEFKWFLIALTVAAFVYVIFLATQMSAVYDPIKTYQFRFTENEVHVRLTEISKLKTNLKITFTDSIGNEKEGRDYHCDLNFKDATNEYVFHFIYKRHSHKDKNVGSEIELISAIDYGLKLKIHDIDHEEAGRLTGIFENEIIDRLSEGNTSR